MDQSEGKVLEEEVTQKLAHSDVGPAPMHQQEALQVTKLSKGVVTRHNGLHPFLTADTNPNVCSWEDKGRSDGLKQMCCNRTCRSKLLNLFTSLLLIMLTSLAPSPMDNVTAFLYFFTKLTTLAFCFGVTRQQITASHSQAMSTKSIYGGKTWFTAMFAMH